MLPYSFNDTVFVLNLTENDICHEVCRMIEEAGATRPIIPCLKRFDCSEVPIRHCRCFPKQSFQIESVRCRGLLKETARE